MADQQPGPVAETPVEEPKKSRAGRNLPAAIGVGVLLGGLAIGVLLFCADRLAAHVGGGDTHRHARGHSQAAGGRLRPPGDPAVARRPGHDLAVVLRPGRRVGRLWRHGRGLHGVASRRAGTPRGAGELPARHLGDRVARDVGAVVREFQRAADLPGRRWLPDVHGDRHRRLRRHRRIRRRGVVRQASDGAVDQPEEVLGGAGRLAALRRHGSGGVGGVPAR